MRSQPRLVAVLVAVTAVAGCGDSGVSTLQSADEVPAAQEATTTSTSSSTTTTTTSLPGDEFEPIYTPTGAILDVIGIAFDETFDLRSLPGSSQPVVASRPPLTSGIESQGRAQLIAGDGVWLEVTSAGDTGWADSSKLARLAGVRDGTADVTSAVGGTPTAPSMLELGEIVSDVVVPSDPAAPPAEIIVAAAPSQTPTAEVVYDVFPGEFFGDDTSIGFRIVVVGRQAPAGPLPETGFAPGVVYELVRVDTIGFCTRGVTSDGFCV
jgi:hypothetical protein